MAKGNVGDNLVMEPRSFYIQMYSADAEEDTPIQFKIVSTLDTDNEAEKGLNTFMLCLAHGMVATAANDPSEVIEAGIEVLIEKGIITPASLNEYPITTASGGDDNNDGKPKSIGTLDLAKMTPQGNA